MVAADRKRVAVTAKPDQIVDARVNVIPLAAAAATACRVDVLDKDRAVLAGRVLRGDSTIAARAHVDVLDGIVGRAMNEAGVGFAQLSAVAAAAGPGLIGGVIVGLTTAKAIAMVASPGQLIRAST